MDIIMEACRSLADPKRFGRVTLYEVDDANNNLHQYFLGPKGNYFMKITIYPGQGIRWDVGDDTFYKKMKEAHSDRWDDRWEFTHPLYGEAKLVKNYMFKKLDNSLPVEEYSICYIDSSGCLRTSSVVDAELTEQLSKLQLEELGY